jgi:hypothetical protein
LTLALPTAHGALAPLASASLLQMRLQPAYVEQFPAAFAERLGEARGLYVVGTHHSSFLTAYHSLLEERIGSGASLHFLLVDPNGAAARMAAMRFPGRANPDQERPRIQSSLTTLAALREMAPDRVHIKTIDFLLDYTAYLIDPDSPSATVYLERCTFRTSGGSRKPIRVRSQGWPVVLACAL